MNIKLTALNSRFIYGRSMVTCVPRDADTNVVLGPEQGISEALEKAKGNTIINAQEVLECIVKQFGFGA